MERVEKDKADFATTKGKRDTSVELYRATLMLGICFIHCVTYSGLDRHMWAGYLLRSCVDGFVFITGYFGMRFKLSKLMGLFSISILCGDLIFCLAVVTRGNVVFGVEACKLLHWYCLEPWFVVAYAFLMFMAPIVNFIVDKCSDRLRLELLVPVLVLVFVWSFLSTTPYIGLLVPPADCVRPYTGMTLLGVYIAGRLYRKFNLERYLTWRRILSLLAVAALFAGGLGLGEYNSPFALVLAVCGFALFQRIHVPQWLGRGLLWLGPSLFSVYLLHSNDVGFGFISRMSFFGVETHHLPLFIVYGAVSVVVFCGCVLLDIPRRILVWLLRPVLSRIASAVDTRYDRLVTTLANRIGTMESFGA